MNKKEFLNLVDECEASLSEEFRRIEKIAEFGTAKILDIFREEGVSASHFGTSSGYGEDDYGRDLCDRLYARALNAEAGFCRPYIHSGTMALAIGLYGLLRPGDTLYSVTGKPYDTLEGIIGINGCGAGQGTLADFGVKYRETALFPDSTINVKEIIETLKEDKSIKVVFIQRSIGYLDRKTLSYKVIDSLIDEVRKVSDAYIFVDNNYGEFTEEREPKADLLCGSLIKNAGGGMAECGGYIVGSEKAVELASYRLTMPGIGAEEGTSLGQNKSLIKGLFYAPHTVSQAIKTSVFAAKLFQSLGYDVSPLPEEPRYDIIQILYLKSRENLINFCKLIQKYSPVDSFVTPVPSEMSGYADEVIMAGGTFVQGATIELSADAPLKEPYLVYVQGGLTFESGKYTLVHAAAELLGIEL